MTNTMKNYLKKTLLIAIAVSLVTFTGCIEDAINDAFTDPFPKTYLGTWVDSNSNEITVSAKSIIYEGNTYKISAIFLITSNGVDVYTAADTTFDGTEQDFFLKQPGSLDELQISTFTLTQNFTTYTKQ